MRLPAKYIQILTLLLTVLIATPCSIKKMYAGFEGVGTTHKSAAGSAKLQCHAFVAEAAERTAKKAVARTYAANAFSFAVAPKDDNTVQTTPFFLFLKEKIPSYILYRTLLI
jgi:hypothetical protein